MQDRYFYNADAEMVLLPQYGRLELFTECGRLEIAPSEVGILPRGLKFRVELPDGPSRGYVGENYGALLRLPECGPVASDGFANDRDFLAPVACYETRQDLCELVARFGGALFRADIAHSPLDVVGWVGTAYPVKYPLAAFNVINTVSYDHPDPSILTVLTSPSDTPGVANLDFVIFPLRWMVAEHTFRPPWFHRNVTSEFMGLIEDQYDARANGFVPGGASLHNCMSAHGPEAQVHARPSSIELAPVRMASTLAFRSESRYALSVPPQAWTLPQRRRDYRHCWGGLVACFDGR